MSLTQDTPVLTESNRGYYIDIADALLFPVHPQTSSGTQIETTFSL